METWSAEIENPRAGVDAARGSEPEDSMLSVHRDSVNHSGVISRAALLTSKV